MARARSRASSARSAYPAAYDGERRRSVLSAGVLSDPTPALRCGELDLGWARTGARQKIRGTPQSVIVRVPVTADASLRSAERRGKLDRTPQYCSRQGRPTHCNWRQTTI